MKVAVFSVRADERQNLRWKRAADGAGVTVGVWISQAVDAHLEHRARVGRPIALAWHRRRFSITLEGGETVTVSGHASPPFGSFAGTEDGPAAYCGRHRHVLVNIRTGEIIATLKSFRDVRALAAELVGPLLRRELPDPTRIVERHIRQSV